MRIRSAVIVLLFLLPGVAQAADVPLAAPHVGPAPYSSGDVFSASNGRGFLTVCAQRRGAFQIFGMRGDDQGRPLGRMFVIDSEDVDVFPLGVASDGDAYLVVYAVIDGNRSVRMARVDDRGVVTKYGSLARQTVSIAWGGSAYVAGYVNGNDGMVTVIATDGTVLRSLPIVIGTSGANSFQVSGGPAGTVIATWTGADQRIHAVVARTSALRDGTFVAPVADESGPMAAESPQPTVVASSSRDSLVVWSEWVSNAQPIAAVIRARRLDATGTPIGNSFVIAQLDHYFPGLSVASTASLFVVVYSDVHGVHLATVSADDHVTALTGPDETGVLPPITLSGGDFGALLIWNTSRLNGVFVTSGGAVSEPRLFSPASASQMAPSVAWCGNEYRAAWMEQMGGGPLVRFGRVRADGTPIDAEGHSVTSDSGSVGTPRIACSESNSLIVWDDVRSYPSTVRAVIVDADATPHAAFEIGRMPNSGPAVVWNGTDYLVAWQAADTRRINLVRIAHDGHPIDVVPQVLQSVVASVGDESPSIAWNGSEYLVAWSADLFSFFYPHRHGLYAVRLTRELTPVGSIRELSVPTDDKGDAQFPLAIAGDDEWGVAWSWRSVATEPYVTYFTTLSPSLEDRVVYGQTVAGIPRDGTFTRGGYELVGTDTVLMIDGRGIVDRKLRDAFAVSHGGAVPLLVFSRTTTDELLPRLYVSIDAARTRSARH